MSRATREGPLRRSRAPPRPRRAAPQVLKTLEVCTPLIVVLALEESRSSARGLVRATIVILVLSQLLGVSVALPALWVPSFLLLSRPRVAGAFLPAGKVRAQAG